MAMPVMFSASSKTDILVAIHSRGEEWRKKFYYKLFDDIDSISKGIMQSSEYPFISKRKVKHIRLIIYGFEVFYTVKDSKLIITRIIDGRMNIEHMSDSILSKKRILHR